MYTGAEHTMLVPDASPGNFDAAINRAYEQKVKWAAENPQSWAHEVFSRNAFWSGQPKLVLLAS
jgi:hypothetical protein